MISRLRSKFFDQYSGDDDLLQGHLMVVSVLYDMRKDYFKDTFFEMNNFPNEEPINCCKFCDNEKNNQLLLRSDHFINPTIWFFFFGLNFMTSIPVMTTYHKSIEVQSFHQSDHLISCLWSKFYDQHSGDDNVSQEHLMVVSVSCNIRKD